MSLCLEWDGMHAIQEVPEPSTLPRGHVRIEVSHALFEPGTPGCCHSSLGTVVESRSIPGPTVGSTIVFGTTRFASLQMQPTAECIGVAEGDIEMSLLIPPVAAVLQLMETVGADLGWTAVVNGDGLIASLTREIARHAGVRRVLASSSGKTLVALPESADEESQTNLQARLAGVEGPIVAIDTTSHPAQIQNLLTALPARSTCVLHGHRPGGVAAVNFYLDVHRKNIRIVGASGRLLPQHLMRASEFLQHDRVADQALQFVQAQLHSVPETSDDAPQILQWH